MENTLEKSTSLHLLASVLQQSGPLRVPDKTNCTVAVTPVLRRQHTAERQIQRGGGFFHIEWLQSY